MGIQLKYQSNISYTKEEFLKILRAANVFEQKEIYQRNILSNNATCKIEINNESLNEHLIQTLCNPTSIQFIENNGEKLKLFNTTLQLPPKIISLTNVLAKLEKGVDIGQLKIGDVIEVEWVPQESFQYSETYRTQ